jgi:hypothetical protein
MIYPPVIWFVPCKLIGQLSDLFGKTIGKTMVKIIILSVTPQYLVGGFNHSEKY